MFRFAATIFLSAFLLFQVQPLTGRYILPWFGGGPSIWTACMLFFQILLLGGYLYSHLLTSRLSARRQVQVHSVLVLVSLLWLPIAPDVMWKPTAGEAPLSRILLLLAATVGAPYFVLATTGPLMQRWFTWTNPGTSPWRLYALSNVGSLLALLSYPFVFEPVLTLRSQVLSWSVLSVAYVVLAALCGMPVWRLGRALI
ncbi:MAG: ferrichrome ABC transporter permease, partial [Planctomycetaceae bacterium]